MPSLYAFSNAAKSQTPSLQPLSYPWERGLSWDDYDLIASIGSVSVTSSPTSGA